MVINKSEADDHTERGLWTGRSKEMNEKLWKTIRIVMIVTGITNIKLIISTVITKFLAIHLCQVVFWL